MTTGIFSVFFGAGIDLWSRSRCPDAAASLTKDPSIFFSDFSESPINAALLAPRNLRRPILNG
jgi:hypothetical protein